MVFRNFIGNTYKKGNTLTTAGLAEGDRGPGMRPKKAHISKTTEPNLKNDYVLEPT